MTGNNILSQVFKKYQTIILPILAVIIALVLFGLVVIPQALKIPSTIEQIQKSESDLQALNSKVATLKTIDSDKFKADLETTFAALPQDPDIAGVFNQVLQTLNSNGVTLDDVNISQTPAENSNSLTDYVLKIDSTGTTANLNNFLDQIKQIPRVVRVQAFEAGAGTLAAGATGISSPNPQSNNSTDTGIQNTQTLQILVTIKAFYQGVPKTQSLQTDQPVKLPTSDDEALLTKIRDQINALPVPASQSGVPGGKTDPFEPK